MEFEKMRMASVGRKRRRGKRLLELRATNLCMIGCCTRSLSLDHPGSNCTIHMPQPMIAMNQYSLNPPFMPVHIAAGRASRHAGAPVLLDVRAPVRFAHNCDDGDLHAGHWHLGKLEYTDARRCSDGFHLHNWDECIAASRLGLNK